MKNRNYFSSFLIIFFISTLSVNAQKKDTKAQEEKIIQVLKAETTAFYNNDYEAWKAHWTHADNSIVAYNNIDGTYRHLRGWTEIDPHFKNMINNRSEEAHPDFNIGDLDIDINGNMAFVIYNEYVANTENKFSKVPGIKTLKKVKGTWKLHSVISLWDRNYQYTKDQVLNLIQRSSY